MTILNYIFDHEKKKKMKLIMIFCVYLGMYVGAYYVANEIRIVINEENQKLIKSKSTKNLMTFFNEQLFLDLKENITSRLAQSMIILAFFFGFQQTKIIYSILSLLNIFWLVYSDSIGVNLKKIYWMTEYF